MSSGMDEVRETAKKVAEKSRDVHISVEAVKKFSRELVEGGTPALAWDAEHHFRGDGEETVAYLFVLDTLNFCFWPLEGKPRWEIEYRGECFSGYHALALSLKKALEQGAPLDDAGYLAAISDHELQRILAGRGELQLMDRRVENVRELGRVLLESFRGKAHELVASARRSAISLARMLGRELSSFRDIGIYEGERVFFYKRAQLLAADLHGAFDGRSWGEFHDMEELTAFADYKLPQVLRRIGVLEYSEELSSKVDRQVLLQAGSREEIEIRANTVWAVELLRRQLKGEGKDLTAPEIDWILWNLGQGDEFRARPYHRTVTVFY